MNQEPDTPRTDLKELELREVQYPHDFYALGDLCRELELELTHSLKNQVKAQAEVERLKEQLYDCLSYVSHDPIGASSAISKQLQRGILATLNPTDK